MPTHKSEHTESPPARSQSRRQSKAALDAKPKRTTKSRVRRTTKSPVKRTTKSPASPVKPSRPKSQSRGRSRSQRPATASGRVLTRPSTKDTYNKDTYKSIDTPPRRPHRSATTKSKPELDRKYSRSRSSRVTGLAKLPSRPKPKSPSRPRSYASPILEPIIPEPYIPREPYVPVRGHMSSKDTLQRVPQEQYVHQEPYIPYEPHTPAPPLPPPKPAFSQNSFQTFRSFSTGPDGKPQFYTKRQYFDGACDIESSDEEPWEHVNPGQSFQPNFQHSFQPNFPPQSMFQQQPQFMFQDMNPFLGQQFRWGQPMQPMQPSMNQWNAGPYM